MSFLLRTALLAVFLGPTASIAQTPVDHGAHRAAAPASGPAAAPSSPATASGVPSGYRSAFDGYRRYN
jgi:hypothetical protein